MPKLDQRVFGGSGLSQAAGRGAQQAIKGIEQDYAAAQERVKSHDAELEKIQKAEAQQEDENWEATQIADDPGDVLQGNLEEGLRGMKTELSGLDLSTKDGRDRKREIYSAYADVNKGIGSVSTLLSEYRTATGPDGTGIDDSTPVRVRKILMGLDKNPGDFQLVYEDGKMRVKGDVDGEAIDEPMGAYLSQLRFSPKTNWDTKFNSVLDKFQGTKTNVINADGSTSQKTTYDPDKRTQAVDELLGGPRHSILSLAAKFGISPERIKEENLTDDQIKEELRPQLDAKLTKDDDSVVTKAAPAVKAEFSPEEQFTYNRQISTINSAFGDGGSPAALGSVDPGKLLYTPGEDEGSYTLTQLNPKTGKSIGEQTFGPGDEVNAQRFASNAVLDDTGRFYQAKKQAAIKVETDRRIAEAKTRTANNPRQVTPAAVAPPIAPEAAATPEVERTPIQEQEDVIAKQEENLGSNSPIVVKNKAKLKKAKVIQKQIDNFTKRVKSFTTTRDKALKKYQDALISGKSSTAALKSYSNADKALNDANKKIKDLQSKISL